MTWATPRPVTLLLAGALPLAAFVYLYALGCVEIPSNGDEFVYLHIARATAASGHWLPLRSELGAVQDTKPPLLFWQAMTAGRAGWTLGALRLPGAVYTLVSAGLAGLLAARVTRSTARGAYAALFYLGCFATYRYGRPLLTDAPETFWLGLPVLAVAWTSGEVLESTLLRLAALGVCVGIACLYKSFALVLPVGLALLGWVWVRRGTRTPVPSAADAARIALVLAVALAVFALWFVADPDPGRVWHEFVVGENAGKFASTGGYLANFLTGGSSVFALALATLANGGLLAPVLLALCVEAWRRRAALSVSERILWIWVLALFLAFALPSQRSGRYLLPAMPALAVLAALAWDRVSPTAYRVSAVLIGVVALVLCALVALAAADTHAALRPLALFWAAGAATALVAAIAAGATRSLGWLVPIASLGSLLMLGAFARSIDARPGAYAPATVAGVRGRVVAVPGDFLASEEAYRFLLPGATIRRYELTDGASAEALAARYPLFAVRVPADRPLDCPDCRVLGERFVTHGRRTGNLLVAARDGRLTGELLSREVLVESRLSAARDPRDPRGPAARDVAP